MASNLRTLSILGRSTIHPTNKGGVMSQYSQPTDVLSPTLSHTETHSGIDSNQQFVADSLVLKDIKNEMCTTPVKLWSDKMTTELSQEMNHIEFLRLRNLLMEYVEELKLRRHNDVENEERIKQLVQEKYELERKCDNEKNKHSLLEEHHRKVTMETKRKFDERIQVLEEESKQNQVHRDCNIRETKALKDEIHNLQLAKYSLEKKLHDQERKLKLQLTSSEQHLGQLSKVDQKFNVLTTYCKQLVDSQSHLDKNVKEAVKLNQVLMYVNEHQKCVVEQQRDDITKLQNQMIKLKAQSHQAKPAESNYIGYEQDLEKIKKQLTLLEAENDSLKKENSDLISKHQTGIEKLGDAHRLIERHLKNAELHKIEATTNFQSYKDSEKHLTELKQAMNNVNKDLQIQKTFHEELVDKWKIQEKTWNEEINNLKLELSKSQTACKELEELNTTWAKQNMDISQCLKEARKRLDIDKSDSSDQTDLCLLHMSDTECQVTVDTQSSQIQTDSPAVMTTQCQVCPVTMATFTQTVVVPVTNKEIQTSTSTISESLTEKSQISGAKDHQHDVDKNADFSENTNATMPYGQPVQEAKGQLMEVIKGQTPCVQKVEEVKGQLVEDVKGQTPCVQKVEEVKGQPMEVIKGQTPCVQKVEEVKGQLVEDVKGQTPCVQTVQEVKGQLVTNLSEDSSKCSGHGKCNLTNVVTSSNDIITCFNDSLSSRPSVSTSPFEYSEKCSSRLHLSKVESSVKENAKTGKVCEETRREVGESLKENGLKNDEDGTICIPPTQEMLPTTTDLDLTTATDSKTPTTTDFDTCSTTDSRTPSVTDLSTKSGSGKTAGKRRLYSLEWKMEDQVDSSPLSSSYQPDVSSLWKHGGKRKGPNPLQFVESSKDSDHSKVRPNSNKNDHGLTPSSRSEVQDEIASDKTQLSNQGGYLTVFGRNAGQNKSLSLRNANKSSVFMPKSISLNTNTNSSIQKDLNENKENFPTILDNSRNPSRLSKSTPVVTNPLYSNQTLDDQTISSSQSHLGQDWSRSRQQGDSQSESRSMSNQQCDSQSDLSPYSRYSAKLRLSSSSESTTSLQLNTKSPSLNSSQTETWPPGLTSVPKQVVREITAEENLFTTKSILKEPSDTRQKQLKNVQFCEDVVMVSPAQTQVSGDQCLFSDPEDETGSQILTDTPLQQESPVAMKKPKLSDN